MRTAHEPVVVRGEVGAAPRALAAGALVEHQARIVGDAQIGHGRRAGDPQLVAVVVRDAAMPSRSFRPCPHGGGGVDAFEFLQAGQGGRHRPAWYQ